MWLFVYGARESDGGILLLGQVSWHQASLQEHVTCVDEFVALQVPNAVEYPPTDLTGMNVPERRGKPQELHIPQGSSPAGSPAVKALSAMRASSAGRGVDESSSINRGEAKGVMISASVMD